MSEPSFHYKSNSLSAYRVIVPTASRPFALPTEPAPTLIAKTTEEGVIGSTYTDVKTISGNYRTMRFIGYGNVGDMTGGLSVLVRVIPRFTGFAPPSRGGLWTFNGAFNAPWLMMRALTDGRLQFLGTNADFGGMVNGVSVSTHSFVSGTAVDIVVTWTGTAAANGMKIYVNGVLFFQGAASGASQYSDSKGQLFESILPCLGWPQGEASSFDLNEMAVWNEVINPTNTGLNLIGPARTSFLTSTAADATPNVPSTNAVRLNTQYGLNNSLVGNLVLPDTSDTRSGVQYGSMSNELTGTYTPSVIDTELVVFLEEVKPLIVCLEQDYISDDLQVQITENESILVIEEKL